MSIYSGATMLGINVSDIKQSLPCETLLENVTDSELNQIAYVALGILIDSIGEDYFWNEVSNAIYQATLQTIPEKIAEDEVETEEE